MIISSREETLETSIMSVDSFQSRVRDAINGKYLPSMRRSMQSLTLYEADRCLATRYPDLRPFQRKIALRATTVDLLSTLDFLNDFHREEIMFRTNSSKDSLAPDLAWRRMKIISREINQSILPRVKELLDDEENCDKDHDEICEMLLQYMYEHSTDNAKPHPPMWEYNHNNAFTVYRVYYRGLNLDPNIFDSEPPRIVDVPRKKPEGWGNRLEGDILFPIASNVLKIDPGPTVEERRAMLKEVKDHTELLKEFEGVIPEEELAERKRALYAALPPVPPPVGGGRRAKQQNKKKARVESPMPMEEEDEWERLAAGNHEEEEAVKNVATV